MSGSFRTSAANADRPRLGLGAVKLGSTTSSRGWSHDVRLVRDAIEHGITLLDTSNLYAHGVSERIVGEAIRGRRDRVTIATKGGYVTRPRTRAEFVGRRMVVKARPLLRRRQELGSSMSPRPVAGLVQDFAADEIRRAVDGSLRRLRVDHIDVFQFHGPSTVDEELPTVLDDLVLAGKVGRFGVGAESVSSALAWSAVPGLAVVQLPFGVLDTEATDVIPTISANGCEVWARGVFGGGLFAGADLARARAGQGERLAALDLLATRHGTDRYRLGYEFVRATPHLDAIVIGIASDVTLQRTVALARAPRLATAVLEEVHQVLRRHPVAPPTSA